MVWRVRRRQATYWDFESPEHTQRVHFIGKLEHHFVSNHAEHIEITDEHPVLLHYRHEWIEIYLSDKPSCPDDLAAELHRAIDGELGGWRSPSEYFNRDVALLRLLEGGYGMLFTGPEPLAERVQGILSMAQLKFSALPRKTQTHQARALIAGKNFVVAQDFRSEA